MISFIRLSYSSVFLAQAAAVSLSLSISPPLALQLGDTLNRQFEAVCETMFGEVESQAVEALDLPGVFRTRSHSYVRAIQAGCSQDDDCLSVFSMSGPQGSIKGGAGECWLSFMWPPPAL